VAGCIVEGESSGRGNFFFYPKTNGTFTPSRSCRVGLSVPHSDRAQIPEEGFVREGAAADWRIDPRVVEAEGDRNSRRKSMYRPYTYVYFYPSQIQRSPRFGLLEGEECNTDTFRTREEEESVDTEEFLEQRIFCTNSRNRWRDHQEVYPRSMEEG
jgi:hypothetical protein